MPTLNAQEGLEACLRSLRTPAAAGLVGEVVVADGGSTDDTRALAEAHGARLLPPLAPGRGGQLAAGCAAARADWLLVVHADTRLEPAWPEAVRDHMARHGGQAGWFRFALDDPRPVARIWEAGVAVRSRLGWPYGDQGLLISRSLYAAVGGYRDLPLMEDLDLARRLGRARLRGLGCSALTSARRYRQAGYAQRSLRNWLLVARWLAGADPADLARAYRR